MELEVLLTHLRDDDNDDCKLFYYQFFFLYTIFYEVLNF